MRITVYADPVAVLFKSFQIYPVRQYAQHLIQQMNHVGTGALQVFDHRFARQQSLRLLTQFSDFLNLLIEYRDLLFQVGIASFLIGNLRLIATCTNPTITTPSTSEMTLSRMN